MKHKFMCSFNVILQGCFGIQLYHVGYMFTLSFRLYLPPHVLCKGDMQISHVDTLKPNI